MVGVDRSSGMLQRARARGVYDELVKAEPQAYLADHADEFDVVISADTLVYFGALEGVLGAACRALKPGGLLVFTVEEAQNVGDGYRINPHGRYGHEHNYIRETMTLSGFEVEAIGEAELRMEGAKPIGGLV